MPLLFSYGTLQKPDVQMATFGRRLDGSPDELVGSERSMITIEDLAFVAESGSAEHAIVTYSGAPESRVAGMALEVTREELMQADEYEPDGCERARVTLASGRHAWVYTGDGAGSRP